MTGSHVFVVITLSARLDAQSSQTSDAFLFSKLERNFSRMPFSFFPPAVPLLTRSKATTRKRKLNKAVRFGKISMENISKELHMLGHKEDQNDDETEDEEVKLNCMGGIRGCQDSDFASDSGEDEQDDKEEEPDIEEETSR